MTRFLKLIRHHDGKWKALPAETDDLAPVIIKESDDAPIDPSHLLNALDTLLSREGGIKSNEEVIRLSSLMKKFSKKLVSRCVYINVLQATKPDILSEYLDNGGWETINLWLQEAKETQSTSFLLELLRLSRILPMTVSRLKQNNTAKVVKSLTKHENAEIKSISSTLVSDWMAIITGAKVAESNEKKKKKSKALKAEKEEKPKTKSESPKPESESPKSPARLKTTKRTSSEREAKKIEYYEDVKIDPEPLLPVPKKPRADRPKTAKIFQKKFRATGLEQETPLPKNIQKKSPTVNKTAAAAVAKKEMAKMMSSAVPERIHEKKVKPESLVAVTETTVPNKAIKLIPAKPRPAHILHESASFIDALISQPVVPIKKKKKVQPKTPPSPTSPTITPPKLEFYKDTLEMNDEKENKKEDSLESEEKSSSPTHSNDEPMDTTNEEGGQTPPNNDDSNGISSPTPDSSEPQEEEMMHDPTQLRSCLAHGKRRSKKKSVKWVEDTNLKEVFYFEMDDNERVNVFKSQNFCDLKSNEVKREREAFELAKRQAGDRMEEMIPWWPVPILIDLPPPLIEPGFQSKERDIQKVRQQAILQEIYFTKEMVPDSPQEPDLEIVPVVEPKVIPLDEENATSALMDYSTFEAAAIPALPEVLTSLMKLPTTKVPSLPPLIATQEKPSIDVNILNSVLHNPNMALAQHNPMSAPYDPGEPVSMPNNPGLLNMPPPMPNMYNMPPENENLAPPSDWRTLEMIQQQEHHHHQQFYGFPMNHNMMGDHMPGMNMRPRMMQDMFRPNMQKGPMHMNMGPIRGRGIPRVPCRHFIGGGCRFGVKCNFLHPGINGPPL